MGNIILPAVVDIPMNAVLMYTDSTQSFLTLFDPTVPSNIELYAGISTNAAATGWTVLCAYEGSYKSPDSFTQGVYYAGVNGLLTQTLPSSGIILQVGYASDASTFNITPPPKVILTTGNNSTTYTDTRLSTPGTTIPYLFIDGIGRTQGINFTFNNDNYTITFGSVVKSQQQIIIPYNLP